MGFRKVVIQCFEPPKYEANTKEPPVAKSLIPEHYADEAMSGLTAEVKADQKDPISFNLFSKP